MKTNTITSKGQITLPIAWRKKHGNPQYVELIEKDNALHVVPIEVQSQWETIYEAPKNEKGISGKEFLNLLDNIINDK